MNNVYYRKYRSQSLDELIGQAAVKQSLKSAFLSGKLAHAYLFSGPRGTGKTSTARILAKMVNCEEKDLDKTPCNKCVFCTSITDGSNLDVYEIDAASQNGVDDIRTLRENIKLAPTSAQKKVYIIDEVHMLSQGAFNALLKTLEEPPSHVLFILATTEIQKIPATILSRVQKIEFKAASTAEASELIKNAAKAEKIEIDNEATLMLAKRANGSFRDAIKYLDQLSSFSKIDSSVVSENLGSGDSGLMIILLEKVAENQNQAVLENLQTIFISGVNVKEMTSLLLDTCRQMLYIKNGLGERVVKKEVSEEIYNQLFNLSEKFSKTKIVKLLDLLQKSIEQTRYTSIAELPLEVALLESCEMDEFSAGPVASVSHEPVRPPEADLRSTPEDSPLRHPQKDEQSDLPDPSGNTDLQKIAEKWNYVLETVKSYNYSLEALLKISRILECGEASVVIEVPYAFHQRILESPKSRDMLEGILSDILGRKIKIATALGKRPMAREELSNIEVAADDEIVRLASEIFNSDTVN